MSLDQILLSVMWGLIVVLILLVGKEIFRPKKKDVIPPPPVPVPRKYKVPHFCNQHISGLTNRGYIVMLVEESRCEICVALSRKRS